MEQYSFFNNEKPKETYIEGHRIEYLGSLPDKAVFIAARARPSNLMKKDLYISSLECALNGYGVVYVLETEASRIIEAGVLQGSGRLFPILPFGFEHISDRDRNNHILEGGGIISVAPDSGFSLKSLDLAKCIAVELSSAVLICEEGYTGLGLLSYIEHAIDSGKELAILKSALTNRALKRLAGVGCPVVSSFSDFLTNPRAICYSIDDKGYGKAGFSFDIMYLDDR